MREPISGLPQANNRQEPGPLVTYHVMAGLHILSNPVADQRWLRGAID